MYGAPMMAPQPMMMAPAPMYAPPPPPPPQQSGPTIITVGGNNDNGSGSPCPACGKDTGNVPRKKIGCVTIMWCLCLTPFMACCYPFCTDSCKDTELVCVKCHTVKSKINANCC